MPRSRSERTKTGVCRLSAKSNAAMRELIAFVDTAGQQHDMFGVAMREIGDREQIALHGAGRHSGRRSDALNIEDHSGQSRRNSQGRQTPPSARCPGPRSRSSSGRLPSPRLAPCRLRPIRLPPEQWRKSPCHPARRDISSCNRSAVSTTEEEGVIGYQVTTVTPANIAPRAAAALPSMMILPSVPSMVSSTKGSCLVSDALA